MPTERIEILISEKGTPVVNRRIKSIGDTAARSNGKLDIMRRTLGLLGGAQILRGVVNLSDQFTVIENRLGVVTRESSELVAVTKELLDVSNRSRTALAANAELFTRVALATRELGLAQSDVLAITESLNQAVILSGANAQEAEAGLIQLSQGLNSGVLQRDELKSVLEQLPVVADIIADQLDATRGELKTLGAEGKITSQVIIEAFKNASDQLQRDFDKTTPTISQFFVIVRNNLLFTIGEINEFINKSETLRSAIAFLGQNIETVGRVVVAGILVASVIAATLAFAGLSAAIAASPIGLVATLIASAASALVIFADQIVVSSDGLVTLADVATGLFEVVVDRLNIIAPFALSAIESILERSQLVLSLMADGFVALVNLIITSLDATVGKITGFLGGVVAVFTVAGESAGVSFSDAVILGLIGVSTFFGKFIDGIITGVESTINFVIAGIEEFFPQLISPIKDFARLVEDLINFIIGGVNSLLRRLQPVIDKLVDLVNTVNELLRIDARLQSTGVSQISQVDFGVLTSDLNALGRVQIGRVTPALTDPLRGLLSEEGESLYEAFVAGFEQASSPFSDFLTEVVDNTYDAARRRAEGSAESELVDLASLPGGGGSNRDLEGRVPNALKELNEDLERQEYLLSRLNLQREVETNFLKVRDDLQREGIQLGIIEQAQLLMRLKNIQVLQRQADILDELRDPTEEYELNLEAINRLFREGRIDIDEYNKRLLDFRIASLQGSEDLVDGYQRGFLTVLDNVSDLASASESAVVNAFNNAADAVAEFATTGQLDFRAFADSIIQDLARIAFQQAVLGVAESVNLGGFFGDGTAVSGTRALGGPVDAGSSFLVGERGPEVFTPTQDGTIIPNSGGTTTNNTNINISIRADSTTNANRVGRTVKQQVRRAMSGV